MFGQTQFQKSSNASSDDRNYHLTSLPSGALYATGYTDAVSGNKDDAFVVRFNAFGEIEWAKTFGDVGDDYSWDLIPVSNNELVGCGYSTSFGTPKNVGTVTRIDSAGKIKWLAGAYNAQLGVDFYRVFETSTGHILAGGLMQSASNSDEIILCKFTPKGSLVWGKTIGTKGSDEIMGITETAQGHYLLSGLMNPSNGFGSSDFAAVKLDTSGSLIWSYAYGGKNGDRLNSAVEVNNAYYFLGWSSSDGQGSNDIAVMKTDTAGKVQWTKLFGSSNGDLAFNLLYNASDTTLVIGGYTDASGSNSRNSLLMKVELDGDLKWAKGYGKTGRDGHWPTGLAKNFENGYYLLGSSNSFSTNGDYDLFMVKTDDDGNCGCNQNNPTFKEKSVKWSAKSVGTISTPSLTSASGSITPKTWNLKSRTACCKLQVDNVKNAHLCLSDTVTLGSTTKHRGYRYKWSFQAKSLGQLPQLKVPYGTPGFYDLEVSATNGGGCKSVIKSANVTNSQKPVTSLQPNYAFCEDDSITAVANSSLKSAIWESWKTQNSDTTYSFTFSETDTFLFLSQHTDDCWFTDTIVALELPKPFFSLSANDTSFICDSITFSLPSLYSYEWNNNTSLDDSFLTVKQMGWVHVSGSDSACENSDSVYVDFLPDYIFDLGKDTSICPNDSLTLSISDPKAKPIWWNGATTSAVKVHDVGTYSVTTSADGFCPTSDSIRLNHFTVADNVFGGSDTFKFTVLPTSYQADSGWTSYSWSTGETTREVTIDKAGEYTLTVSDSNGCDVTDTLIAVMTVGISSLNANSIQLFPNPTSGSFQIRSGSTPILEVMILGLNGQQVRTYEQNISTYEVIDLPKGMYLIEVSTQSGKMRKRLVLE